MLFFALLAFLTAAAEIAGALGIMVGRTLSLHNALNGLPVEGLPQAAWYYWVRLPFQPLAIWWALFSAELIRWPLRAQEAT